MNLRTNRIYLASYYPLSCNKKGRLAIKKYSLPPYIDGSCRREPDFENDFPCITGLCRPGFAEKLKVGDTVAYVTNKKGIGSRKLVAILEVVEVHPNHEEAFGWFNKQKIRIPNNLMVEGNKPFDLDKTHQKKGWDNKGWGNQETLEEWDNLYVNRAKEYQKVARCIVIYKNLYTPLDINEKALNRPLCAQTPPRLTDNELTVVLKSKNEQ